MKRRFNTTGLCNPNNHYMVDITGKLNEIKEMIDYGDYFTINRGRQYGKTTTLFRLREFLKNDYTVASISFESWGDESFSTSKQFCQTFLKHIKQGLKIAGANVEYQNQWHDETVITFDGLADHIAKMCENEKIVLMIDEVDKTSDNRVFLQFLGILRANYLKRAEDAISTFHSVILVGVYDIKNIKLKMINDGIYQPAKTETHFRNSPWNIAVEFKVDMAFDQKEIMTMLAKYEIDHKTGMDLEKVAGEIFAYTNGYPFMVSRLCQLVHNEKLDWDIYGVRGAVSLFVREDNQLFKDMSKNLENYQDLYHLMHDMLVLGLKRSFSHDDPVLEMALRYGYISFNTRQIVSVFNKVFETRMLSYFVAKSERLATMQKTTALYHNIATDDYFDMALCLEKFADFFNKEIFPTKEKQLLETQYRLSFLSYLKPLLNGIGHYHIESQLSDERRMDLVVNYGRHEYVLELKRIFTESDRTEGIDQLLGYMNSRNADTGYYLTFDFRKKSESKIEWLEFGSKRILEINV